MLTAGTGLREKGHKVYYAGRQGSVFLERAAEREFETLALEISGDFNPATISSIRRFISARQIDSIIPNFNKDVRLAGLASSFKRPRPRPVLLHRNGLPIVRNKRRYRISYKGLVDGIITNTRAILDRYMTYGWIEPEFVRVIHNGIDTDISIDYNNEESRSSLGVPANGPVVGLVGRLVPQKQPLMFLEAAKKILAAIPEANFLIVGEGPLRDDIVRHAKNLGIFDRVFMPGLQKNVFPVYRLCDVLLLTSEDEGLPNVVLEGMLSETAVVAFDVGGVRELITEEKTGVVVGADDVYLMAEKAIAFLKDDALRQATGKAARAYICEHFSVGGMIDKLEAYLLDLHARRERS